MPVSALRGGSVYRWFFRKGLYHWFNGQCGCVYCWLCGWVCLSTALWGCVCLLSVLRTVSVPLPLVLQTVHGVYHRFCGVGSSVSQWFYGYVCVSINDEMDSVCLSQFYGVGLSLVLCVCVFITVPWGRSTNSSMGWADRSNTDSTFCTSNICSTDSVYHWFSRATGAVYQIGASGDKGKGEVFSHILPPRKCDEHFLGDLVPTSSPSKLISTARILLCEPLTGWEHTSLLWCVSSTCL